MPVVLVRAEGHRRVTRSTPVLRALPVGSEPDLGAVKGARAPLAPLLPVEGHARSEALVAEAASPLDVDGAGVAAPGLPAGDHPADTGNSGGPARRKAFPIATVGWVGVGRGPGPVPVRLLILVTATAAGPA